MTDHVKHHCTEDLWLLNYFAPERLTDFAYRDLS